MSWIDTNKLFELVERLQEQAHEEASRSAILITLNKLNTFAERYFEQDERFLESMRSVDLKSRRTLHQNLLRQLAEHTEDFKDSNTAKISADFFRFLDVWVALQRQSLSAMPEGLDKN